jgi:hypothetical protein
VDQVLQCRLIHAIFISHSNISNHPIWIPMECLLGR